MMRAWGAWVVMVCGACAAPRTAAPPARPVSPWASCSDRPAALELAAEGDRTLRINVAAASAKYEAAIRLDPENHELLWKLARAQEKTESYAAIVDTLTRATALAPDFASYWHRIGKAWLELARAGQRSAYAEARRALLNCTEKDPKLADCHALLGEAQLWLDEEPKAAQSFTRAVQLAPERADYYVALAELYSMFKRHPEAERVLSEGARLAPDNEANGRSLYLIQLGLFEAATRRGDRNAQLAALDEAPRFLPEGDAPSLFVLGSSYLRLEPPEPERAARLLTVFVKRVCKGSAAARYREQCEISQMMLQRLGQ